MSGLISFAAFSLALIIIASSPPTFADDNLLTNADFEEASGNVPKGWLTSVSTLFPSSTDSADQVHSGTRAAVLKSSTRYSKYLYQTVAASISGQYHLSVFFKVLTGNVKSYLRLFWFGTPDASGSELGSAESEHVGPGGYDWQELSFDINLPDTIRSFQPRLYTYPDESSLTLVAFDGLSMRANSSNQPSENGLNPRVEYALPGKVTAGESFLVSVKVSHFPHNQQFFLKGLGGSTSQTGEMYAVSTWGPENIWLPWNGSWTRMPTLTTNGQGEGSASLFARYSAASSGVMYFLIRVKDIADSETKTITVTEESATTPDRDGNSFVSEPASRSPVKKAATASPVPKIDAALILGTSSASPSSGENDDLMPISSRFLSRQSKLASFLPMVLIGLGALILGLVGWSVYNVYNKRKGS